MKSKFFIAVVFALPLTLAAQDPVSESKADDLFNDGVVLLAHDQPGAAHDRFLEFLQQAPNKDPRRQDAEYDVALTSVTLYHDVGEKLIADFTAANPLHPSAESAWYDLGSSYYQQKNYTKASPSFGKADFQALSSEQQNTGRFRWAFSLFTQMKHDEALRQFSFIKSQGGAF